MNAINTWVDGQSKLLKYTFFQRNEKKKVLMVLII